MKKEISTAITKANIADVMDLLSDTPTQLERLSGGMTREQLQRPLGVGERSFSTDLAHLIHSEARSSEAIYLALLLDEPLLPNVHPERQWGRLLRFDLLDVQELLSYFNLRRAVLLRVLRTLTEKQWERSIREERKKRKESVYWRARSLAIHELEHVSDLQSKKGRLMK